MWRSHTDSCCFLLFLSYFLSFCTAPLRHYWFDLMLDGVSSRMCCFWSWGYHGIRVFMDGSRPVLSVTYCRRDFPSERHCYQRTDLLLSTSDEMGFPQQIKVTSSVFQHHFVWLLLIMYKWQWCINESAVCRQFQIWVCSACLSMRAATWYMWLTAGEQISLSASFSLSDTKPPQIGCDHVRRQRGTVPVGSCWLQPRPHSF